MQEEDFVDGGRGEADEDATLARSASRLLRRTPPGPWRQPGSLEPQALSAALSAAALALVIYGSLRAGTTDAPGRGIVAMTRR